MPEVAATQPPQCVCDPPGPQFQRSRGHVTWSADNALSCWHAETDTLPWVRAAASGSPSAVDVVLPIGAWSQVGETPKIAVSVWITSAPGAQADAHHDDDAPDRRYSTDDGGGIDVLNAGRLQASVRRGQRLRGEPGVLEQRRHYVDLEKALTSAASESFYYRLVIEDVPAGAVVDYTVEATTRMIDAAAAARFRLRACAPSFSRDDIAGAHRAADDDDPQAPIDHHGLRYWVVMHRREAGFDHVRVDFLSTIATDDSSGRPRVTLQVGDQTFDLAEDRSGLGPDRYATLPLLDRDLDAVLVSLPVPQDQALPTITVTTLTTAGTTEIKESGVHRLDRTRRASVRLMFINYCIQGLNDLFEYPNTAYHPPRTYMQLTMRDERGAWSSRPGSAEDGEADGYALTLDAHRYYGVPSLWAFNAPVLTMIAHDCPDDLRRLREDVRAGVVVPVNAGFGAHRPPYYAAEVNRQEIRLGQQAISELLPGSGENGLSVYYPDQRIYASHPDNEVPVYADHTLARYLVLDRSTLCHGPRDDLQQAFFPDPDLSGNHLLADPGTGCTILPIEDTFRDGIDASDDDEVHRGKIASGLRRLFIRALCRDDEVDSRLLVYADDADKASGCGWFDGDYAGRPVHFNDKYQAALAWIARHPWVRAVTVDDVDDAARKQLPAPVSSASCPSVDPGGATNRDRYGNLMHFDTWVQQWRATPSAWLGRTLGELVYGVQESLITWPPAGCPDYDHGLVDLAWMSFLALNHEMMWNKEPLEGNHVNQRCGVLAPEAFVVTASLQIRNTEVYLNAAVWAGWAQREPDDASVDTVFTNAGPVVELLRSAGRAGPDGLHWDDDPLPNDLLYNRRVLAVLDRNGGRITHLFVNGRSGAVCVSGTPKTYQWIGPAGEDGSALVCDGEVLENTVLTPNHLYVASDVQQSAPRRGWLHEDRPRQSSPQFALFPDTFNEYEATVDAGGGSVTYAYAPPRGEQPPEPLTGQFFAGACTRDAAARAGSSGGVVWHRDDQSFRKTINLDGTRLTVRYQGVPPGHRVANEFSVDVRASMRSAAFQRRAVDATGGTFSVTGPGGERVSLTTGHGCHLAGAARVPDLVSALADGLADDYLRLHRVFTDAVEVECADGGSFHYYIDFH